MKRYNTPHRSRVVKTRLTDEEYADFTARLAPYGMSQSEFIRQAITRATIRPIVTVSPVNDELLAAVGKLTAEYGRIGGNLNQIARYLNEYGVPYNALSGEVRVAISDLAALKFEVLQKVGEAVGNIQTYGIFAGADWKDDGKLELLYAEKREIFYWDMTYNADFIYRDLYLDRHWDAAHLLRLHPVDKPMYDLTMKYILPIGYHNVNLFLLDWSSDDYGNLCFNDLLDYLYRLKYNDYLYARDYPRYTTPYSYSAIPAKLFEDTIVPYFDISMEEFRERALYDAENDIYPWQDISCDNVLYFPSLIPEVTECIEIDDSTKKLIVNVMCPDYQTDKLFVHEVTIRVLSDGEYQYIGNQITYRSDINIPSPQARIPVQRFSMDR